MSSTSRGIIFKGFAEVAGRLSGLIIFPIMARYAGAAGYGAYSQVNTVIGFIIPFASLGLGQAMVRFFATEKWTEGARNRLIRIILFIIYLSVPLSILMAIVAPALNRLFLNWEQGVQLFRWGALLIVLGAIEQLLIDFLRSRQRLVYLSSIQLIQIGMMVVAVVILLPLGYSIVELIKAVLIIKAVIILSVFIGFWTWDQPIAGVAHRSKASIRRMVRFGLPLTVAGVGLWLMNFGDRLVIGYFMTAKALGLYGAVYLMAFLLCAVNTPLNLPLYPRLMRAIASGDTRYIAREVRIFHRYANLILVPSAIFLIVIIRPLLLLIGGEAFRVDILLVGMIVAAIFLDQWNSISHYTVSCVDQVTFGQNTWLSAGVLNLGINLFTVPLFGLHGAALATFITFLLLEFMFFLKANKYVPIRSLFRFDVTWKAGLSSLIGVGIIALLIGNAKPTAWSIIACSAIFGITYLFCMILFREIDKSDFLQLTRALFINLEGKTKVE